MTLQNALKTLLALVLVLPAIALVLVWAAAMMRAMGDPTGATVVAYAGTAFQILWLVSLVGLVVALAFHAITPPPPPRPHDLDERELD